MGNIYSTIGAGVPTGTIMPWPSETPPRGWLICDGREVSRTTYARLFAVIGTRFGEGDGSTTFNLPDLRGRVPVGVHSTDEDFDQVGKRGGAKTHTLTLAEIPHHDHGGFTGTSGEHNHGSLTGNGGEHNHGGSTASGGLHSHNASASSGGEHYHYFWKGEGYYNPEGVPAITSTPYDYRSLCTIDLIRPAGAHVHSVTINSNGLHSHVIDTSGIHTHIISTDGSHTHGISGQGGGQAHNNLQPYIVLNFIIKT